MVISNSLYHEELLVSMAFTPLILLPPLELPWQMITTSCPVFTMVCTKCEATKYSSSTGSVIYANPSKACEKGATTMAIPCVCKSLLSMPWCLLFLQLYASLSVGARGSLGASNRVIDLAVRRHKDSVGPRDRPTAPNATSTMNFLEIALHVNYSNSDISCPFESGTGTLDLEYRTTSVAGAPWTHLAELKKGNVAIHF